MLNSTEKMAANFLKDIILTAAKNVCDDPEIVFDTVEGAKEALIKEVNRLVDEYSRDPSNLLSAIPLSSEGYEPSDPKLNRMMEALFGINTDIFDFDVGSFIQDMEPIEEACETLGIPKSKNGGYYLKGDDLKKVCDYIRDKHHVIHF